MKSMKQTIKDAYTVLQSQFSYTNVMQSPKIKKVVISVGTGSAMKKDRTRNDHVVDRISKITGQKPAIKGAKKSIASFKIRQGDPVGVAVTLRGERMYAFLDKLVHIALPRTKDFRGINRSTVNNLGNMTLGIKEHTIFPETADEDISQVFGLAITIETSANNKPEAFAFFEYLGFPFKKEDEKKKKVRRKK